MSCCPSRRGRLQYCSSAWTRLLMDPHRAWQVERATGAALAFSVLILVVFLAIPASAERRVALFVDYPTTQQASGARVPATGDFAETLRSRFGFDIIVARQTDQKQLLEHVKAFRQLLADTEFAFLLISGRFEHDASGTYALTLGREAGKVPLDDIFSDMVGRSRTSVVVLEALDGGMSRSGLVAGVGRMPQIDEQLLITLIPGPLPSVRAGGQALDMLSNGLDVRALRPAQLIKGLREEVYLRSAGLRLVQTIGSLPHSLTLEATIERSELLAAIRQRSQEICTSDFRDNRTRTEQNVLSHFAKTIASLRLAALNDNNNFLLQRLLEELRRSGSCPYLPPPQAPAEAKATPAPSTPETKEKVAPEQPVATITPVPAPRPSEPLRDASRSPPSEETKTPPVPKAPDQPRQRKAQSEEAGGDDEQKSKRSGRSGSSGAERTSPPARERSTTSSTPSRGPINIPNF